MKYFNILFSLVFLTIFTEPVLAQPMHSHTNECSPFPMAVRIHANPLFGSLKSYNSDFLSESVYKFGYNVGGDFMYYFYEKNQWRANISLGLGYRSLSTEWSADYQFIKATTDVNNDAVTIDEKTVGVVEKQTFSFFNISLKPEIEYSLKPNLNLYYNLGLSYGIPVVASYSNSGVMTRSGNYAQWNALVYDVDIDGSAFFYPLNKEMKGSGNVEKRNNLSLETGLGVKYKYNPRYTFYGGFEFHYGLKNLVNYAEADFMAKADHTLNTLAVRADEFHSISFGLELGVQINIGKCKEQRKKAPQFTQLSGNISDYFTNQSVMLADLTLKSDSGNFVYTAKSDSLGKYNMNPLLGMKYSMSVVSAGYRAFDAQLEVGALELNKEFNVRLKPNAVVVKGKVLPAKALVVIKDNAGNQVFSANADDNGAYEFKGQIGSGYTLDFSAEGFKSKQETYTVPDEAQPSLYSELLGYKSLKASILNRDNNQPLQANVKLKDNAGNMIDNKDVTGEYEIVLLPGAYQIEITGTDIIAMKESFTISNNEEKEYKLEVKVKVVNANKTFELGNVAFESGKVVILASSYVVLDALVKIMQDNPEMKIEIGGHSDNSGSLSTNMKISGDRANECMKYVISKGIDASMLTSKGYGPTKPMYPNDTPENRSKNRRVEFKILN